MKTIFISPETKHRHLNFILVSMNDCACARLEREGLYFNAFIFVSELLIGTDRKIWYIDFLISKLKLTDVVPKAKSNVYCR